jgi:curved DNA-binding protein CbpA
MEGQLSRHPLAELIREIIDSELSGALRLSREAAKVAVYFDSGQPIYAASNLRAHRLREILKRQNFKSRHLEKATTTATDEELAQTLIASGDLKPEELQKARSAQALDVLRTALLWTEGDWHFNQKVRIPPEMRVTFDVGRLLLETARHLPFPFVKARADDANAGYSLGSQSYSLGSPTTSLKLLPAESFVLTRAQSAGEVFKLSDISANGLSEEDHLRGVYALSLSGVIHRTDWDFALNIRRPDKAKTKRVPEAVKEMSAPGEAASADIDAFLARMNTAKDYYEVLDVPKVASGDEIKDAYHKLARQYHPDRFHQSDSGLRAEIGSAFARIAQAYETLSDSGQRVSYDKKVRSAPGPGTAKPEPKKDPGAPAKKEDSRAKISFRRGMEALEQNKFDEAARLLAEAATLEPREGRYRAQYGRALTFLPNSRRIAESELQAAVTMEPNNSAFRVMLAELYQRVGLRRRAETEVTRALVDDPKNQAARALLSKLRSKQ